ncbi:polyphosphate kinase 1 [Halobaculum gomorrense]|uniref:Polyphosphate kinase n=1 Tax=Halobaculum gomorrense TaxID=43928 RepID=A0A1M5TNG5_9EURY|nr:polyphosphate kinase 1 [Halobaculum gomorrense]SHH52201.1 polyphosphate kinase [Halobaculum gomorrense]
MHDSSSQATGAEETDQHDAAAEPAEADEHAGSDGDGDADGSPPESSDADEAKERARSAARLPSDGLSDVPLDAAGADWSIEEAVDPAEGPVSWARFGAETPPIANEPVESGADIAVDDERLQLSRELSELAFQRRVLHEAEDDRNPVLHRLRFLGITTKNLDEFFMKRVGGLKQQIAAGVTETTPDGRTPREQWKAVLEHARDIFERQSRCYAESVDPALREAGIEIVSWEALTPHDRDRLAEHFERQVMPTLTPLTFDPAHPFPFISNLSLSIAVLTRDDDDEERFSRIKVPQNRPRLVPVDAVCANPGGTETAESAQPAAGGGGATRFLPLERLIEANLDSLFPETTVSHSSTFRVTRNAEVRRNEEVAEGLIEMIEDVLRQRRFATVVRLEVADDMPTEVRDLLVEHLDVSEREVFVRPEPLALDDFDAVVDLDRPDLKLEPWTPQRHPRFEGVDPDHPDELFAELRRDDVLLHHPYQSFGGTVQTFLDAAAHDPDVLAIKAAIYRTAPDSKVIASLIDAAKNGKQVAVMVELKARFDEENNLRWVKRLEEEGIHVAYGTIGLKTHSKVALVVRQEDGDVATYSHVGTGNYHSGTAKGYVDLGLVTADEAIGGDLVNLFNSFTTHARHREYDRLLVAPENLRSRVTALIRTEAAVARAGGDGRIVAKMNALEDPEIVRELYRAARAGVEIDLIVRGICRLRPGIEGLSDTVRVHSVVGRFLEHSRIYYFANAEADGDGERSDGREGDPAYFVGSADWMTRNLDRRVEAVAPVDDPSIRAELETVLAYMLADNRRRWVMRPDGRYVQLEPGEGDPTLDTHERLAERARRSAPEADSRPSRAKPGREPEVDLEEVYTDSGDP